MRAELRDDFLFLIIIQHTLRSLKFRGVPTQESASAAGFSPGLIKYTRMLADIRIFVNKKTHLDRLSYLQQK